MTRDFRLFILFPTTAFLLGNFLLIGGGVDLVLGDWLFRLQGGTWRWRDAWLTSHLIHDQGRNLVGVALLALLIAIAFSHLSQSVRPYRKGLYYVLVSALITVAIVNLMKEYSAQDCPWDLARYGGENRYVSLFAEPIAGQSSGGCFPAGHASGAYCWLGLFFLARRFRPQWRFKVLGGVLSLGVTFGIAQQLRGAHFVSHDLWTLYIGWMSACLCYFYLFRIERIR